MVSVGLLDKPALIVKTSVSIYQLANTDCSIISVGFTNKLTLIFLKFSVDFDNKPTPITEQSVSI